MSTAAATRGRLIIAHRVVEKVASQAASEIADAGGQRRGLLGSRQDMSARPKVTVDLAGEVATIGVRIGLPFPTSIRRTANDVRAQIAQRVTNLTGVTVSRVDVVVTWLATDDEPDRSPA
jgi:uncharacterized alkaline shock family protein YloU